MTYCLAIQHPDGIIFASDSRTNAGVDYINIYSKMHVFKPADDRLIVLLSAGSLATTQEVLDIINRDLISDSVTNLANVTSLPEAVQYVGKTSLRVQSRHEEALIKSGFNGEATFILGGQISQQPNGIYLIYPQGNYISASYETPYLQIGESKYGKPILDRMVYANITLEDCARLAIVSQDATIKSNITVGPPVDLAIYRNNNLTLDKQLRFASDDFYYQQVTQSWQNQLNSALFQLPKFDWEL